ncbi:hypothetical protein LIER_08280 [Lithospermum erythrorhizon]|uniref:CLAVATA3/ESR (CLE)-related protein 45 n=1 Tax=Lithospermum erythrorhizon TaxID=34254 RepID=A0AAV3PDD7_LITER
MVPKIMIVCPPRFLGIILFMLLVAIQQDKGFGMRNANFALRLDKENGTRQRTNQRLLRASSSTVSKNLDSFQSSKRKVRKGSDPIHNKT